MVGLCVKSVLHQLKESTMKFFLKNVAFRGLPHHKLFIHTHIHNSCQNHTKVCCLFYLRSFNSIEVFTYIKTRFRMVIPCNDGLMIIQKLSGDRSLVGF